MEKFRENEIFVVGGAVRDLLLNKAPKDYDFLALVPQEQLLEMGAKFVDPSSSFPVFLLDISPYGKCEVALPRKERKEGNGHRGFSIEFSHEIPIEEDLSRRDFTINSMAMNPFTEEIIDPFNGKRDLQEKVLRHTSKAFSDDPLRVFRALRFSCKGFSIALETKELMKSMESELSSLPMERIYSEMFRAMGESFPEKFWENMVDIGVGKTIFPEIFSMNNIPAGPEEYHGKETVFEHSINVLKDVAKKTENPVIRLAGFFHDFGKIFTSLELWPKHYGHDERKIELEKFMVRIKADNEVKKVCMSVLSNHMKAANIDSMRKGKKVVFIESIVKGLCYDANIIVAESDSGLFLKDSFDRIKDVCLLKASDLGITPELLKGKTGIEIKSLFINRRAERLL